MTWEVEHIGPHTLYRGDCREVLPTLAPRDAVICDPPYGVNLGAHRGASDHRKTVLHKAGYASYEDSQDNFHRIVVPAIRQALMQARRGALFMADTSAWALPAPDAIGGVYLPSGMGRNPWGWASLQHCLFYGTAPNLHHGARATVIHSTETVVPNGHPCPKPLGWMRWLVSMASLPGETVIDPFMGSGTTGVACVQLGRVFTGIEIERQYFDIACQRMHAALAQPDLFLPQPSQPQQQALFAGGR